MIGLIDYDLINEKALAPNLELMKISSYYKRQHEQVELIRDCREFTAYNIIYLRQDRKGAMPEELFSQASDRIKIGGRAYYGKNYKPLPAEIERCQPDTYLYSAKWVEKKKKPNPGLFQKALTIYTDLRLSQTNFSYMPIEKRYLLYDYNIGDNPSLFRDFMSIATPRAEKIHFLYPAICQTYEDAGQILNWGRRIAKTNIVQIDQKVDGKFFQQYDYLPKVGVRALDKIYDNVDFSTGCILLSENAYTLCQMKKKYDVFFLETFKNLKLRGILRILGQADPRKSDLYLPDYTPSFLASRLKQWW